MTSQCEFEGGSVLVRGARESVSNLSTQKTADPRVGLVNLSREQAWMLEECFRQFRIQTVSLSGEIEPRLQREKFEGIVLLINENSEEILRAARSSSSNKRLLIFAVVHNAKDVLACARYGINASFQMPLDRQAVLKGVKATHLLILHEFRRYVRLPLIVPVRLETNTGTQTGSSCEISGGGMSIMVSSIKVQVREACTIEFALPNSQAMRIHAEVSWIRESERMLGAKFQEGQEETDHVKRWIDEYLGMHRTVPGRQA